MTLHDALPYAAFGSASLLAWVAMSRLGRRAVPPGPLDAFAPPERPRPGSARRPAPVPVEEMVRKAAPVLSQVFTRRESQAARLNRRLGYAGFHSPEAAAKFLAVKVVCSVFGLAVGAAFGWAFWQDAPRALAAATAGAALGVFTPDLILARLGASRRERIFRTLPDAVDLIVVALDVGQSVEAALTEVTSEMKASAPDLCAEFELFQRQTHLGRPRQDAWRDLSRRAGVDDLAAFASILAQAERFGTGVAEALRDLTDEIRVRRRHIAEERVHQTAVKLLFPLLLFVFPGVLVVLVGPAALALSRQLLADH